MQYIPIKTRILTPPQDDLYAVFDEYLQGVKEGDIVAVSSKVVAIHEGNSFPLLGTDKEQLVRDTADLSIERPYWHSPLTVVKSAFIGTAGIDESNADGYLIKLPEDGFRSAEAIHAYLKKRFQLTNVGVVITDSNSSPLRRGATGVAVGWWGFEPTIDHIGEKDLFERKIEVEVTNLADGLAAGANVVMGEVAECQPMVIIRGTPGVTFTEENTKDMLFVPFHEDTYRVLYERFLPNPSE